MLDLFIDPYICVVFIGPSEFTSPIVDFENEGIGKGYGRVEFTNNNKIFIRVIEGYIDTFEGIHNSKSYNIRLPEYLFNISPSIQIRYSNAQPTDTIYSRE